MNGTAPFVAAADWGTSSFRLWLLAADGTVLGERRSDEGLIVAGRKGFETVLEAHLAALGAPADLPVLACGMVGARTGWAEADYLQTPVRLDGLGERATHVPGTRRPVFILPGVAQRSESEPDVMRGEETKILGLGEGAEGLVVMPGTHTKWARLEGGSIAGFSTFMTGEIFAHLRNGESSVLRGAVEGAGEVNGADPVFAGAVREAVAAPALTSNRLFGLRAGWLLHGWEPNRVLARMSGLMIGLEVAGAAARWGGLSGARLVAAGPAADLYAAAIEAAGFEEPRREDADACVRRGLLRAAKDALRTRKGAAA